MNRRLLFAVTGAFAAGLLLTALFLQYQQPGMVLNRLATLLGCG